MDNKPDLLEIEKGAITAPAGCGKTQAIADALKQRDGIKPILVLTHTNAGVAALRGRFDRAGVLRASYRLSTIDGWAIRLIATFPARSGSKSAELALKGARPNYRSVRRLAAALLDAGHVSDVLRASYRHLIVDEYQDCSVLQHALVVAASSVLPTCVLGDPMQAIFGFGGDELADWDADVCSCFPVTAQLKTPWRWINAGLKGFGEWLLHVRGVLERSEPVDLVDRHPVVKWVRLDGTNDHRLRLAAAAAPPPIKSGRVVIIGDSLRPESQRQFASQTPGAVAVENVDLTDLVTFAQGFSCESDDGLRLLVHFAQSVMTNVSAGDLLKRVESLRRGTARNRATEVEKLALQFVNEPSYVLAANLLIEINKQSAVRAHRPAVLRACVRALQMCQADPSFSFHDAAIRVRDQNRLVGRVLPGRAVGSTLFLKGLEAELAVILDAEALDARNLYVAMTRGSHALTLCSRAAVLRPG